MCNLLRVPPEWLQVSLHVRVPPEAAAAGLGEPTQVYGLLFQVSFLTRNILELFGVTKVF